MLIPIKKPKKKFKRKLSEAGLERKRKSARAQMILNNPMKKESVKESLSLKMKGRITSPRTLFKKGNQFGKKNKGREKSKIEKVNQGMKMKGKKLHSEEFKKNLRKRMKLNNPMKNTEIVKKQKKRMSETRKRLIKEGKIKTLFVKGNQFGRRKKEVKDEENKISLVVLDTTNIINK